MEKEVLNLILDEIREMKGDMSEIKNRLTNLEIDMSEVKKDTKEVKKRLDKVEELAEFNQETCQSIKNVVTSHYMEFKKYVKSNNTQHNLYNAKLLQYNKEN